MCALTFCYQHTDLAVLLVVIQMPLINLNSSAIQSCCIKNFALFSLLCVDLRYYLALGHCHPDYRSPNCFDCDWSIISRGHPTKQIALVPSYNFFAVHANKYKSITNHQLEKQKKTESAKFASFRAARDKKAETLLAKHPTSHKIVVWQIRWKILHFILFLQAVIW